MEAACPPAEVTEVNVGKEAEAAPPSAAASAVAAGVAAASLRAAR